MEEVEPEPDLKVVEYSAPKVSTSDQPTNMLPFVTLSEVTLSEVTLGVNLTEAQFGCFEFYLCASKGACVCVESDQFQEDKCTPWFLPLK